MTLAVYSAVRDLGRITLDGGKLTATDPVLQGVADVAVNQAGGDPAKAYQVLDGFTNGYLTIITDPAEQDAQAGDGPAAAFRPDEARDGRGRWASAGAGHARQVLGPRMFYETAAGSPASPPRSHDVGALAALSPHEAQAFHGAYQGITVVNGSSIDRALRAHGLRPNTGGETGARAIAAYRAPNLYVAKAHLGQPAVVHEIGHFLDDHLGARAGGSTTNKLSSRPEWEAVDGKVLAAAGRLSSHFDPAVRKGGSEAERFAELYSQWRLDKPYDLGGGPLPQDVSGDLDRYFEAHVTGPLAARYAAPQAAAPGGNPRGCAAATDGHRITYHPVTSTGQDTHAGGDAEAAWDPRRHLRKHKGEHGGGEFTKMPGTGGGHGRGGTPEAPPEVPSGPGHVEVLDDPMARGQLADPGTRAAAAAEVYHGIGIQETFIPHQARKLRVRLGDPEGTSDKTLGVTMLAPRHDLRTGRLTVDQLLEQGEAEKQHGGAEGTTIRLGPWITDAVAGDKAGQEQREAQTPVQWRLQDGRYKRDKTARPGDQGTVTAPWWVPSDPQHNLTDTTVAHESGHAFAESVPGTDMDTMQVWGPVADAIGIKRPDVFGRTEGGGQRVSPQKWLADHRAEIARAVSMYGARSYGELKAELWSEYTTNATPRAPAKIFGDFVRAYHAAHPDIQAAAWSHEEDPE